MTIPAHMELYLYLYNLVRQNGDGYVMDMCSAVPWKTSTW